MAYFIGQNARVGVAINAEVDGTTFGQTAGSYEYLKIKAGGFTYEPRNNKSIIEELDVDPTDYVVGGLYYTWTLTTVMSYSYREKLYELIMGGAITSAGAAPITHTFALADKVKFGSLAVEYSDQKANSGEIIKEVFANACVTAISISESPEGNAEMTVSGLATAMTRTTNNTLSSVTDTEPVKWNHFTPTLNGTTTYRLGSIGFDIGASLSEGDFDHAATAPATLNFIGRSGVRDVSWKFDIRMDAAAYTLTGDTTAEWTGDNKFVWNNGGAGASERELSIQFGDSFIDSASRPIGAWGRETRSVSMKATNGTTDVLAVVMKNTHTIA